MKLEMTEAKINPFGGNVLIHEQLNKNQVLSFIDNYLGNRPKQAKYKFSDFLMTFWSTIYAGGSCIEDSHTHLKPYVKDWLNGKAPSSDSILNFMQGLSAKNEEYTSEQGITYRFNSNEKLNQLNLGLLKRLKLISIKAGADNVIDYDNVALEHDKKDKKPIYAGGAGYHPGVTFINGYPAFIENRDGNAPPMLNQAETLRKSLDYLTKENIPFKYFRADAASYQKDVIRLIERSGAYFYIRANSCENLRDKFKNFQNWKEVTVNGESFEINETTHALTGEKTSYRLVVTRLPRKDGQADLFTGDSHIYRGILTNDWTSEAWKIVGFYNQRGCTEQVFGDQNQFGWAKLPFSWLNENTVYLIFTAMGYNVFCFLKQLLARKTGFVDSRAKLKRFIFEFVIVPVKWVKRARQWVLKIFTHKPYHLALE